MLRVNGHSYLKQSYINVSRRESKQSWQVSPLKGNNQGYYRVITLWGEILSAIDKWQKLGRNSFTSFIALQSPFILPCA